MAASKSIPAKYLDMANVTMQEVIELMRLDRQIESREKQIVKRDKYVSEREALMAKINARGEQAE